MSRFDCHRRPFRLSEQYDDSAPHSNGCFRPASCSPLAARGLVPPTPLRRSLAATPSSINSRWTDLLRDIDIAEQNATSDVERRGLDRMPVIV